jgi:hypothetical protein
MCSFLSVLTSVQRYLSNILDCKDSVNITKQNLTVINPQKYLGHPAFDFRRGLHYVKFIISANPFKQILGFFFLLFLFKKLYALWSD